MHGAILIGANLMGAQFTGTQLQGAMLINAQLQAALIEGASLNHAFLNGALLMGAKISNSELQDMLIGDTIFHLTYIQHDRGKVRLANAHQEQAPDGADSVEAGSAGTANSSISDQFMHAELQHFDGVIHAENVKPGFDLASLTKLRQAAIAQLAAANKMQYTDFDKVYEQAEETEWDAIETKRKKLDSDHPSIKEYTINFACDAGSSPYITAGLIRDEKIMWVLNKISKTDAKEQAAKQAAVEQAVDVLSHLISPKCDGAKKLSPTDIVAIGFMKQRLETTGKSKKQPKKAENSSGEGLAGSATAGLPESSTPQAGLVH
jgi:hypothetical protein